MYKDTKVSAASGLSKKYLVRLAERERCKRDQSIQRIHLSVDPAFSLGQHYSAVAYSCSVLVNTGRIIGVGAESIECRPNGEPLGQEGRRRLGKGVHIRRIRVLARSNYTVPAIFGPILDRGGDVEIVSGHIESIYVPKMYLISSP